MAINPETQYPGKIAPSTPEYPYGAARNITTPGDGKGTPWEAALVNDIFGFQQAALAGASIVPSGSPEKVGASQYLSALKTVMGGVRLKFASVGSMQAGDPVEGTPSGTPVFAEGGRATTGLTVWEFVTEDTNVPVPGGLYAKPLGAVFVNDYNLGGVLTQAFMSDLSTTVRLNRTTAVFQGEYTANENLVCDFNTDATDAIVTTRSTWVVGRALPTTQFVREKIKVVCPKMHCPTKWDAGSTGVRLIALSDSEIHLQEIKEYELGLQIQSHGSPVVFNQIYLNVLYDNYRNMEFYSRVYTPDPAYISYIQENLFIGGHFFMAPQASVNSDRWHIGSKIDPTAGTIGTQCFIKPNLEIVSYGAGQPTDVFCKFVGSFNASMFVQARVEGTGDIIFDGECRNNCMQLSGAPDSFGVKVLEVNEASKNQIDRIGSYGETRATDFPHVMTNTLNKDFAIYEFYDPFVPNGIQNRRNGETQWSTRMEYASAGYKEYFDTNPRIKASSAKGLTRSDGVNQELIDIPTMVYNTGAFANGTVYQFDCPFVPVFIDSASNQSFVKAEVVAYRESDGKRFIGTYTGVFKYDTGASSDYTVLSESLVEDSNGFDSFSVFAFSGGGQGGKLNLRVQVTDSDASFFKIMAKVEICSPEYSAN